MFFNSSHTYGVVLVESKNHLSKKNCTSQWLNIRISRVLVTRSYLLCLVASAGEANKCVFVLLAFLVSCVPDSTLLALPVWGVRFVKYLASLWASIYKLIDIKPLHSVKMVKTWHVTSNSRTSYLNEGLPQGEVNNEGWPHILWRDILSDH